MQYKLIGTNDTINIIKTVLQNRGIEDWKQYMNLSESVVQDYNALNNMDAAVQCFVKHYERNNKITIMPDEDCDGYTSAAMLWLYIKSLNDDYPISYVMHDRPKQHGLDNVDLNKFSDAGLVIIADASSNDAAQCNQLIEKGIDVIILDHHDENYSDESEDNIDYQTASSNKAIIVNNQLSPQYKNKDLSGAGIVYRFLQALDEEFWNNCADGYLDLMAVGNIADVMDMRSLETRYLVNQGLQYINNKFLQALAVAQEYSTKGIINIHNIAWYFAPVINAVTRMGNYEERDLVFKAFTEQYDEFEYTKRDGTIARETIYEKAARVAKNIKSRQDKQRDIVFNELKDSANLDEKVVILQSKTAKSGLVGLSCMKLADLFKRPVIVVKEVEKNGQMILCGSCRNFNGSPIPDLKDLILQTGAFEFCSGHGNAAGLAILPENVGLAMAKFRCLLQDVDFDIPTPCDFILDVYDITISFIKEIDDAQWVWCTGVSEPTIAVENITVARKDLNVQGKNSDSVTFEINNIKYVQFKLKEGDTLYDFVNSWEIDDEDVLNINVIGICSINNYKGTLTPQFIIQDCAIVQN